RSEPLQCRSGCSTGAAAEPEERRENCRTSAAALAFDSLLLFNSATTYSIKSIMTIPFLSTVRHHGAEKLAVPLHQVLQQLNPLGFFHPVIADLIDDVFD